MGENAELITGGCLCGTIRYQSTVPAIASGYCHCQSCRKNYGGVYAMLVRFKRVGFRFSKGQPANYRSSDLAIRSFCEKCGSSLEFYYPGRESVFVLAGTLDDIDKFQPQLNSSWGHSFVADKVAWHEIADDLPQHQQSAGFLKQLREQDQS